MNDMQTKYTNTTKEWQKMSELEQTLEEKYPRVIITWRRLVTAISITTIIPLARWLTLNQHLHHHLFATKV